MGACRIRVSLLAEIRSFKGASYGYSSILAGLRAEPFVELLAFYRRGTSLMKLLLGCWLRCRI